LWRWRGEYRDRDPPRERLPATPREPSAPQRASGLSALLSAVGGRRLGGAFRNSKQSFDKMILSTHTTHTHTHWAPIATDTATATQRHEPHRRRAACTRDADAAPTATLHALRCLQECQSGLMCETSAHAASCARALRPVRTEQSVSVSMSVTHCGILILLILFEHGHTEASAPTP
jgi:hypothetical protein